MKNKQLYLDAWKKAKEACLFCGRPIPWYSIHHLFRERRTDEHLVPCCIKCHNSFHSGSMDKEKALLIIDKWFPEELFYIENNNIKLLTKCKTKI
jgi:hypothetical protein